MAKALYFGFNPPFLTDSTILPLQSDERLIKNDLLQLLLTVPGERIFRPNFGTDIRSSLFEPSDDNTYSDIKQSIVTAIANFEPRVKLTKVEVAPAADENIIVVQIFASLTLDPNRILTVELKLPTGPGVTQTAPRQVVT